MNAEKRFDIGDKVIAENGTVLGTVRYFTGDGDYAFVKDTAGKFHKLPVKHLSKVQPQTTEVKSDGDGL